MPLNIGSLASCANIGREAYYVMDKGLASYTDLDSRLTLEDAMNLIEFHQVSSHNKALIKELEHELGNSR